MGLHYPCYTSSVEGSAQAREQKVAKMLPRSCFLGGTVAKTGQNAPVGLHHPCYTPSVEGSTQAREQKVTKMLPWSSFLGGTGAKMAPNAPVDLQAPFIRLLWGGLHKHGSKKWQNCSRGHLFEGVGYKNWQKRSREFAWPSIQAFCGRCCNCMVTKTGKNVAVRLHDPQYTSSVAGVATARSQKRAKT